MNKKASIFKPEIIKVNLGDKEYSLVYDMNAMIELEKLYDSIDDVIRLIMGNPVAELGPMQVTYNEAIVKADDIAIDGKPLTAYLAEKNKQKASTAKDTLNLLWAGILHENAVWENDEVVGYTVKKNELASNISFRNIKDVNAKLVVAILQDLIPQQDGNEKNVVAPEQTTEQTK